MAVVYADSPSQAYAQSAARDQERVQNFLQSLAQNQQTQLTGYNAAVQQAAVRQKAEDRQRDEAVQVAEYIARAKQAREAEGYKRRQDALTMMLKNKEFARDTKYQDWLMGQPTARQEATQERQRQEAEERAELAKQDALEASSLTRQVMKAILPKQKEFREAGLKLEKAGERGGPQSLSTAWDMLKMALFPLLSGKEEGEERKPVNIEPEIQARIAAKAAINKAFQEEADRLLQQHKVSNRFVVDPKRMTITPLDFAPTPSGGPALPQFRPNPLTTGTGTTAPAGVPDVSPVTAIAPQPSLPTATNPTTGARVVFRNGEWQPLR